LNYLLILEIMLRELLK